VIVVVVVDSDDVDGRSCLTVAYIGDRNQQSRTQGE